MRAYLRFTVQGLVGTITSAKLRVYANLASSVGHQIAGVADLSWGGTTIAFSNAPTFSVCAVCGASGPFAAGSWIEIDITPSCPTTTGRCGFALTTTGSTAISYASREATNKPELVINVT